MKRRGIGLALSISSALVLQAIIAPQKLYNVDIPVIFLIASLASSFAALYLIEKPRCDLAGLAWQPVYGVLFAGMNVFIFFLVTENLENAVSILRRIDVRSFLVVVIFSLSVSVVEEVVFRRWLLEGLLKKLNAFFAITLSALVFQVSHFTLLPTPFFLGIIAGYLAYRHKSLLAPVLLHLIYDTLWDIGGLGSLGNRSMNAGLNNIGVLQSVCMISLCITVVVFLAYILFSSFADLYRTLRTKTY